MTYEVETDTKLAEAHGRLARRNQTLEFATSELRRTAGQKKSNGTWNGSFLEALSTVEGSDNAWVKRQLDEYNDALTLVLGIKGEINALNALYTGWSRFFLVTNTNGHIHSSLNCSTCYATTTYGWLPQLSGLTEAEAVADQGEILCSVCFPSAPVAWTTGVSRASTEAREARQAKSAALAAKKAEKALGTVLRVGRWQDRIETIAAAKTWLTDAAEWGDHPNYTHADIVLVSEALAAHTDDTAENVWAAAQTRAAKRNR